MEGEQGKVFIVYTDINRLEGHMSELAPEDEKVIEETIKEVRKCTRFEIPVEKARELYSPYGASWVGRERSVKNGERLGRQITERGDGVN